MGSSSLAAMLPFLYVEVQTMATYGLFAWLDIQNPLDMLTYALQVRLINPDCDLAQESCVGLQQRVNL